MRGSIEYLKTNFEGQFIAAEIGVARGDNAVVMLRNLDIGRLYLVDPYIAYSEKITRVRFDRKVSQEECDNNKKAMIEQMKLFFDKVCFLKENSETASKMFSDRSLDFVYIDGNHDYEYLQKDLELWLPKTKFVLCGHNYDDDCHFDIKKAVDEFADKYKFKVVTTPNDIDWRIDIWE